MYMHLVRKKELKDGFYEKLEEVFDHFPKYYIKILLGDFNAQLFHKLSYSMFRHYRVIPREPVINALPSYSSISNADVGNTVYN
jgi:hypothetical protein